MKVAGEKNHDLYAPLEDGAAERRVEPFAIQQKRARFEQALPLMF